MFCNLAHLTTLILQDCEDSSVCLHNLASQGAMICLKRLVVVTSRDTGDQRQPSLASAVDALPASFSGLRTFVLSSAGEAVPLANGILQQSTTLKELYIDVPNTDEVCREWYSAICTGCTQLEQIALPMTSLRFAYKSYLDAQAEEVYAGGMHDLGDIWSFMCDLSPFVRLSKLVTVRILDVQRSDPAMNDVATSKLAAMLAKFIARKFEAFPVELSIIALGRKRGVEEARTDGMMCYLVQGRKRSWPVVEEPSVQRVSKEEAIAEEPRSELLDIQHNKRGFLRFPRLEDGREGRERQK